MEGGWKAWWGCSDWCDGMGRRGAESGRFLCSYSGGWMVSRDGGTGIGCAVALVLVQLVLGWGGCLGNVGGSEVLCGLCCAVLLRPVSWMEEGCGLGTLGYSR